MRGRVVARAVVCLGIVVLLAAPVVGQLLGVEDPRLQSFGFASKPPQICEIFGVPASVTGDARRRVSDPRHARRVIRAICDQDPSLSPGARCASKRGWRVVVAPAEAPCK
jgi:hypothetical protein